MNQTSENHANVKANEKEEPWHAGLAERILANLVVPSDLRKEFDFQVIDHVVVMVPKEEQQD